LAGKSVFLQIIGNDNANISAYSPQHRPLPIDDSYI